MGCLTRIKEIHRFCTGIRGLKYRDKKSKKPQLRAAFLESHLKLILKCLQACVTAALTAE